MQEELIHTVQHDRDEHIWWIMFRNQRLWGKLAKEVLSDRMQSGIEHAFKLKKCGLAALHGLRFRHFVLISRMLWSCFSPVPGQSLSRPLTGNNDLLEGKQTYAARLINKIIKHSKVKFTQTYVPACRHLRKHTHTPMHAGAAYTGLNTSLQATCSGNMQSYASLT